MRCFDQFLVNLLPNTLDRMKVIDLLFINLSLICSFDFSIVFWRLCSDRAEIEVLFNFNFLSSYFNNFVIFTS